MSLHGLKISNGDLAVRGDGQIELVSGPKRIEQDLTCWSLEPLRTDRMYPRFGSTLSTYIGAISSKENHGEIRSEVTRIVNNYMAYQQKRIEAASLYDMQNVWTTDEIIGAVSIIRLVPESTNVAIEVELETLDKQISIIPIENL